MNHLTSAKKMSLRTQAHKLNPYVNIGNAGLIPSVIKEVDNALNAHALIKVRVFEDDRLKRLEIQKLLCEKLNCFEIQHIGKLFVLWREKDHLTSNSEQKKTVTRYFDPTEKRKKVNVLKINTIKRKETLSEWELPPTNVNSKSFQIQKNKVNPILNQFSRTNTSKPPIKPNERLSLGGKIKRFKVRQKKTKNNMS